nr:Chain I, LEU-ASP-PRO-GLU-THR-GLY-GLU-PHE-LEU [Homo sapiens]
LDPETGEFL